MWLTVSFVSYCVLLYVFVSCAVVVIMCVYCEWVSAVCLYLCVMFYMLVCILLWLIVLFGFNWFVWFACALLRDVVGLFRVRVVCLWFVSCVCVLPLRFIV